MNSLTLSITTIGDLLLRKTITNGEEPIKDVELCVPPYQRPYKWTARNAIQLLDDIIDAKNSNKERYRVGTLILHKTKEKEQEQYNIVDGQQRTITFSLLLTALGEVGIEFLHRSYMIMSTIIITLPTTIMHYTEGLESNQKRVILQ